MSETTGGGEGVDPLLGQTINDRYTIVSLIARGGMGKVYKAEQSALGRVCALKILSPNHDGTRDPEFHRRFSLEASTAARLSHPNTVTIFDYGKDDAHEVYYIAMEFLDGRTLHRAIHEEGSIPEARANHIAQQICRSVHEAHALGVVHRDLKPGNVLLCERGEETDFVKVLDFGLVKDVTGKGQDLTQTGVFMGSPKYMAPEQVTSGEISARTDVYAVGIILYEMLCGKPPFEKRQSMSTLVAHVNDAPPPLAARNPTASISPAIEAVVMCCLEKSPDKRYATMRDLIKALKRASGGDITDTYESLPRAKIDFEAAALLAGESSARTKPSNETGPTASISPDAGPSSTRGPPSVTQASLGGDSLAPPQAPPTITGIGRAAPAPTYRVYAVALAAALIGGGGAALVLARRPPEPASQPRIIESVYVPVAVPAAALAVTASNPAAGLRLVRIETDPSGARVSDRGTEVCLSTPCELVWRGEGAKLEHRLLATRVGFKPGIIVVAPDDEKATTRLEPVNGDATIPAATGASTPATATATVTADHGPTATPAPVAAAVEVPTVAPVIPTATAVAPTPPAVQRFEEGMTRPTPISVVEPAYTREALEARVEGTVIAKCVVTVSGALTGCRIVKGVPHMDQAVLNALAASKYAPATLQGKPVSVDYIFTKRLVLAR